MLYTIEKATKSKNYLKQAVWTKTDITENVVMPILDVARLDRALDTSAMSIIDNKPTATKPFTRYIIRTGNENIYRTLQNDTVELIRHGAKKEYKHNLELIEPTKELERFVVDNTTITNLLAFLYEDIILPIADPADWTRGTVNVTKDPTGSYISESESYPNTNRYNKEYLKGQTILFNVDFDVKFKHKYRRSITSTVEIDTDMELASRHIIHNGIDEDVTGALLYKLEDTGEYTIREYYEGNAVSSWDQTTPNIQVNVTYEWSINALSGYVPSNKKPTKYTIKQVLEEIISKIASETTARRKGLDAPLFKLDPNIKELDAEFSPEFTFTQNTLFGILEQVGNYIHAIPRLIPTPTEKILPDGTLYMDDWSDWSTITFDFLGEHDKEFTLGGNDPNLTPLSESYEIVTSEQEYDGENYATAFAVNVQNSFQTNKQDYISLVEPYEHGFVSTRTEDANFEISNDGAVIKTSRPIQRIVSLEVGVELTTNELKREFFTIDITPRVYEATDYNLLIDYARDETNILKTKSSAIYYTRGTNVINGLAYYPPQRLNIEYLAQSRSIQHIISIMGRAQEPIKLQGLTLELSKNVKLKDLMFRIKYIPYYNFKAMQYKSYVDENGGNNTLFYNQQNAQQVDIESLGENVRGALMMTANKEFSVTGYSNGRNQMKVGDILHTLGIYGNESDYYAYQINREFIDRNTIKNTLIFSKNFNKWNDYIAIKKNYREWEISNRESVETNPIANQFCIISDHSDYTDLTYDESQKLKNRLLFYKGFINYEVQKGIIQSLGGTTRGFIQAPIRWVYAKTTSFNEITQETETREFFLPCACFGFGNSMILNFATQDNYSAGTTVKPGENDSYALENFVEYGDRLGNIDTMELAYGYASMKRDGFANTASALVSSKEFYKITANELKEENIAVDFRGDYPFVIKKDSRQQLNFTAQLNFVSDTQGMYISPNLVNKMIYVGAEYKRDSVKYVYFKKAPDIFLDELDVDQIAGTSKPTFTTRDNEIIVGAEGDTSASYVGVGLVDCNNDTNTIDKNSKILLYYKKRPDNRFYMKLRSRI